MFPSDKLWVVGGKKKQAKSVRMLIMKDNEKNVQADQDAI